MVTVAITVTVLIMLYKDGDGYYLNRLGIRTGE